MVTEEKKKGEKRKRKSANAAYADFAPPLDGRWAIYFRTGTARANFSHHNSPPPSPLFLLHLSLKADCIESHEIILFGVAIREVAQANDPDALDINGFV